MLYGACGEGGESARSEVHKILANIGLVLMVAHAGGAILASIRHHENLARATVTGEKRAPEPGDIA